MPLKPFEKQWCLGVLGEIKVLGVYRAFESELRLGASNASTGFYKMITDNLNAISLRLNSGDYDSSNEWIRDQKAFFLRTRALFSERSLMGLVIAEISRVFNKKVRQPPKDKENQWQQDFKKARVQAEYLLQHSPLSKISA